MTNERFHYLMMWVFFIAIDHCKNNVLLFFFFLTSVYHILAFIYYTFKESNKNQTLHSNHSIPKDFGRAYFSKRLNCWVSLYSNQEITLDTFYETKKLLDGE